MFFIIEIDSNWTVGIDIFKNICGIRLGFIAIHIITKTFEEYVESVKK